MRHKLISATLFAATMAPGGQADEPAPGKQVAALSEQHRLAAIKGDTKLLDAVLADDWVVVGPTGAVETKRQQQEKKTPTGQTGVERRLAGHTEFGV